MISIPPELHVKVVKVVVLIQGSIKDNWEIRLSKALEREENAFE